jgi:rubrerythrin
MANNSQQKLIEKLQNAIDAENTLSKCCGHLFSLIRNGRIRSQFQKFSEVAKENIEMLRDCLKDLCVENFMPQDKCKYCKIDPESFSLQGAINLGLEIINACIKFYKELANLSRDKENRNLFDELTREKINQRNFLKKENEFIDKKDYKSSIVNYHCIPEVASKLWK